jgi:hypothetical protein
MLRVRVRMDEGGGWEDWEDGLRVRGDESVEGSSVELDEFGAPRAVT